MPERSRWYARGQGAVWAVLLALTALLARAEPLPVLAEAAPRLAVLYPDLGEPYRSIFNAIIEGIEKGAGGAVRRYPLGPSPDPAAVAAQLRRNGTRVVIALGRQGLRATAALRDLPVVLGGVVAVPEDEGRELAGIALTPDPAVLFARLRSLAPGVRRVFVVYDPRHSDWLLAQARAAARAQGLELVAQEAGDLATAARLYREVFAGADKSRDAIWLPQDPTTVDEDTILPLVLREAWTHDLPVFSSSFLHVRKGALFALYPDNAEMGRALARLAQELLAGGRPAGMQPLRAVLTAVNLRTASHLGLNLGNPQQRFDFVFPEP